MDLGVSVLLSASVLEERKSLTGILAGGQYI